MEDVREFLLPGLRLVSAGRLLSEPAPGAMLDGVEALLVLDLEMSGPSPATHEVLDVGGVRASIVDGFPETGSFSAKVKPRHIGNAVPGALKVVGYSPKAWRDAGELGPAMAGLAELGRGTVVCGWGLAGDIAFLSESFRRVETPWPFPELVVDVQPIARQVLHETGQVDRFNLGHVADRLGLGRMGEHSALADAYATYDVLVALWGRAASARGPISSGH